jgi:hypothetical protein
VGTNAAENLCIPFERRLVRVLNLPRKKSLSLIAHLCTFMLPVQFWYPAVLRLSRLQASIVRFFLRKLRDRTLESRLLDRWLAFLSRTQVPFPIPWWTADYQDLAETAVHEDGIVYCSANTPLLSLAFRALADLGYPTPTMAVACQPGAEIPALFWGAPDNLPVSEPSLDVLYETHATLQNGGSVLLMADPAQGYPYSPGLFRLAQANGSRVIFVFAELEPDGHIEVQFQTPPDPFCTNESSIQANIYALDLESQRILFGPSPQRQKAPLEFPKPFPETLKRSAR